MLDMTIRECFVLDTPPAAGWWNMAVDDWMLEEAVVRQALFLRWYRWSPLALSLGYFQNYGDITLPVASVVRRRSGGGAILHDRELTYSFAMPLRGAGKGERQELYSLFHQSLSETLTHWGVTTRLFSDLARKNSSQRHNRSAKASFLCFERHTPGDLVYPGDEIHKIAGSAQCRMSNGILQHGSVLLAASPLTPQLPGIVELTGQTIADTDLAAAWTTRLATLMNVAVTFCNLNEINKLGMTKERIELLARERHCHDGWIRRH